MQPSEHYDARCQRIRLRLHWGGKLRHGEEEPGEAQGEAKPAWRYIGGEMFNESVPASFRYADLCLKLNEKVGYTTSIKYQAPGEDLSPNELVSITGDDDLQEMYDEYVQALRRPGTPVKTFRIKVFLFPALQDELDTEAEARALEFPDSLEPMQHSLGGDGFDPDEWEAPGGTSSGEERGQQPGERGWCGDDADVDGSTEQSGAPSEMQWAPHARAHESGAQEHANGGGGAGGRHGFLGMRAYEQQHGGGGDDGGDDGGELPGNGARTEHSSGAGAEQQQQWQLPPGVMPAFAGSGSVHKLQQLFAGDSGSPIDRAAITNLLASVHGTAPRERGGRGYDHRQHGITEEIGLMDPYHEADDDSPPGTRGPLLAGLHGAGGGGGAVAGAAADRVHVPQVLFQRMPAADPWGCAQPADGKAEGVPPCEGGAFARGVAQQPNRRAPSLLGPNLPSHISVFGSDGGGPNLPSHISAFGSDGGGSRASAGDGDSEAASPPRQRGRTGNNGLARGAGADFLPSHISIFGDLGSTAGGNLGLGLGVGPDADMADTAAGGGAAHVTPGGHVRQSSRCITQEFASPRTSPRALRVGMGGGACGSDGLLGDSGGAGGGPGSSQSPNLDDSPLTTTPKLLDEVVKVPISEVHIIRKIGEGAFGEVSFANVQSHGLVAIKWLKRDRFAKYSESFMREAEVLAKLNHPNIIRMYGVIVEPVPRGPASMRGRHESGSSASSGGLGGSGAATSSVAAEEMSIAGIMTDYVRGGSLSGQLRAAKRRPTLRERVMIAVQASRGMAFLHAQTPAVIHFDLKPDNLLVDGDSESLHVKVADFGLSKHKFQNFVSCRDLRGTLPYMAPELVSNPNQVSEKCDVWSMGVVMWEMYTLEVPYRELSAQQILMALMQGSIHLHTPSGCEPEWRGLIEMCMDIDSTARPTFKELTAHLDALLRQLFVEG